MLFRFIFESLIWRFPETMGTPKSSISRGFSIINHPFGGTPIYGNHYVGLFLLDLFRIPICAGLWRWLAGSALRRLSAKVEAKVVTPRDCRDAVVKWFESKVFHRKKKTSGWWFGTSILFSHILGISSSQLTFIFFRAWAQPPTRHVLFGSGSFHSSQMISSVIENAENPAVSMFQKVWGDRVVRPVA